MNTQQQQQDDGHIIMFPYTRFLALARFISQRKPNIKITFVNTPLNIKRLQSAVASDNNICLAELPFSSADHGLPPDSDNTNSLPPHLILTLLYASETPKPSFENLITQIITTEKRVPNCIIADTLYGWVHDIAKRVGTFHFAFTCGAYGSAMFVSTCLHLPHRKNDDSNDLIQEFQVPKFPGTCQLSQLPVYLREADKENPHVKFFGKQISRTLISDGMLCNSVEEIEAVGLKALRNLMDSKPVWTGNNQNTNKASVVSRSRTGKEFGISPESCIEWLNLHKPSSVLYISFGSESAISSSQMMELALGLEKSGNEFDIKSEIKSEWLPEGFFERMNESNKGLLVKKWAPQLEILSHKSTGAFLSHCGWNSVLESLSQGVPIIGWPMGGEQAFNAKMLEEEQGVSVQLANGNEDEVVREDVKKVIAQVMDSSETEEMRKKAMVIAQKISAAMREDEGGHQKGSSVRSIDDFLETVTSK
ncbi:hypothetical protein MKX01_019651 [Papaver californicum]|nr:hypothetical protein MKX01_019651 [Papaver californicum]